MVSLTSDIKSNPPSVSRTPSFLRKSQNSPVPSHERDKDKDTKEKKMSKISRLLHKSESHHGEVSEKEGHHKIRSRAATLLHIKNKSEHAAPPVAPTPMRATTHGELNSSKKKADELAAMRNGIAAPRPQKQQPLSRPASSATLTRKDSIQYNPYGLIKTPSQQLASKSNSFYLNGSGSDSEDSRLLPLPVENPNMHLPSELHQLNVNILEEYSLPEKNSKKDKSLGSGASATVRTILGKQNSKVYALKKFQLFKNETSEEFYKRAAKEYIITKNLDSCLHVVKCYALVKIPSSTSFTRGWGFILEYCKGGDLFDFIRKPNWKSVPLNEKFCLFKQLAFGINNLHESDIVHRDIKPENVLIDSRGVVKITDFGVADYGHEIPGDFTSPIKFSTAFVGSAPYSPPEVMDLKDHANRKVPYNPFKMDHWALGMMLFCVVYQGTPFSAASRKNLQFREYLVANSTYLSSNPSFKFGGVTKGPGTEFKYAKEFKSTGASRCAWRLCDEDPETRYTLPALFKDPWFQQLEVCIKENKHFCNFVHHDDFTDYSDTEWETEDERIELDNRVRSDSSQNPSRSNSTMHRSTSAQMSRTSSQSSMIKTPVKSMLDVGAGGTELNQKIKEEDIQEAAEFEENEAHHEIKQPKAVSPAENKVELSNGEILGQQLPNLSLEEIPETEEVETEEADAEAKDKVPEITHQDVSDTNTKKIFETVFDSAPEDAIETVPGTFPDNAPGPDVHFKPPSEANVNLDYSEANNENHPDINTEASKHAPSHLHHFLEDLSARHNVLVTESGAKPIVYPPKPESDKDVNIVKTKEEIIRERSLDIIVPTDLIIKASCGCKIKSHHHLF
ncbi:BA75_01898T0 [Komagataella pastoris]|uniref:mitogen-activated protein kinase kinase n=1 Tax=Komagataella pastoris TaxID=4922 RepID=A0A1B2JAS1_PICPA|nr:BA75_01898T0 [Komagataella pastoris]